MYKFIDLFCGLGGFRIALEKLGCECVFSSEINAHAKEIYYKNFGEYPQGDITKIDSKDIPDFDILCAGFPCQPFSSAGHRLGFEDTRGTLFFEIARILKDKQPSMFILENVKGLLTHNNGETFETIINVLKELDYNVSYKLLNASDFGVPQSRERIIILGHKNKKIDFDNIEKNSIDKMEDFLEENEHLILDKKEYTIIDEKYITRKKSGLIFVGYLNKNKRKNGVLPNTEHLSRCHRQCNRIYSTKGLCPTLTSGEKSGRYYIYDGEDVRKLTINECYRFMGYDDNYIKIGSNSQLYERIGNSVCINMIYESAKLLIK